MPVLWVDLLRRGGLIWGERSSTTRQRMAGKICCLCSNILPDDPDHKHGERLCAACIKARQPKRTVRMFFSEMPMGLDICFVENDQQVGRRLRYKDPVGSMTF
jgi:hypothetical protein